MFKIFIVIPNWNGAGYLKECLESLKKIDYPSYKVVLVDNGSEDNSIAVAEKLFPGLFTIKNAQNFGFARAVNQGCKLAVAEGADGVLLLNNDTVVKPDFLTRLVKVMDRDPRVGIVGGKILYFIEPYRIWFAGGDFVHWRVSGKHRYWTKRDCSELNGVLDSDFITGCLMLIRKNVFNEIGYFFEPYFLSVEDLDFCYLAGKRGWKIKVELDAEILHKVSLSREGEFSFSNGYYGTRNRLYFAFRRTRNYTGGLVLLFMVLPIRIVQWTLQKRFPMIKGTVLGVRDFFLNKMGQYGHR